MKETWKNEPLPLLEQQCRAYFRAHPVFDKLLTGFREKYASYGTFGGTVVLRSVTRQEIEDLEGFFQKSFHGQKSVSVSAVRFEKALKASKFASLTPREVLELYFAEEMTGKKERQQREAAKWQKILAEAKEAYAGTLAGEWIAQLDQRAIKVYLGKGCSEANDRQEEAERVLSLGARILNGLPYLQQRTEYLAVFAARITGNPHGFDPGTSDGQLLYLLVQWAAAQRGILVQQSKLFPALQKQKYYLTAGILRDDISNYAILCGVHGWKADGSLHQGMEGFFDEKEMVQVPLSVIAGWQRITCPNREIYIVENPSVYAMLCAKWEGRRACMCVNGQPRLSALLVLDLLAAAEVKIWYAGDFDPEGLLIAQKIKAYYQGECVYWHMSAADYEAGKSGQKISPRRMKMLSRIADPQLIETAEAIRKAGMAGFQENICERYLEEKE